MITPVGVGCSSHFATSRVLECCGNAGDKALDVLEMLSDVE